jgi:Protein of unknown function (DUF3570)
MTRRPAVPIAALTIVLFAAPSRADDSFVAKTQIYVDSDHTTVVSPLAAISRDAWKGGTLNASYVADVVSSASIDVVSNATKQMNDFRSEITAGLSQKLRTTTLSGSYIYSTENDYQSHNVELGVAQDLFDRNTTLSLGYSASINSVGRTGDQTFHRSLLVNGIGASWSQVINKATIAQLSFSFAYNNGYQASPYRFVRIESPDLTSIAFKVPETEPQDRFRYSFVAAINRHLFTDTSLQADYRIYTDSWGVVSHTIQVRYFVTFKDVTLRLRERFYFQSGADFFKSHYTTDQPLPAYVTADRELSTFWSNVAGAKISWRLPWVHRALAVEAKCDVFYFYYTNFALLSSRVGADLETGISVLY